MIEFTEFVLPNGRQRPKTFRRSEEVERAASQLVAAGHRLEMEVLRTGQTSLTVEDGEGDETLAIVLVKAGGDVGAAVDRVVLKAFLNMCRRIESN